MLRADKILIATGSSPHRPPEFAFEDALIYDSDELLTLERLPQSLAVVGAGVIGSEYACTFAALGSKVELIDGRESLLPFLDAEVSRALHEAMEQPRYFVLLEPESHRGIDVWGKYVTR